MNSREFPYEHGYNHIPPGNNVPLIQVKAHRLPREVDDDAARSIVVTLLAGGY